MYYSSVGIFSPLPKRLEVVCLDNPGLSLASESIFGMPFQGQKRYASIKPTIFFGHAQDIKKMVNKDLTYLPLLKSEDDIENRRHDLS